MRTDAFTAGRDVSILDGVLSKLAAAPQSGDPRDDATLAPAPTAPRED